MILSAPLRNEASAEFGSRFKALDFVVLPQFMRDSAFFRRSAELRRFDSADGIAG